MKVGFFDGILGLAGIATLLFGISFVAGAIEEKEPQAAQAGSKLFGALGLGLLLVAVMINRGRES